MHSLVFTLLDYIPMCLDCYVIYRLLGYTLTYQYTPKYRFFSIVPILLISILRYHLAMTPFIERTWYNVCDTVLLYAVIFSCSIFFYKNSITARILWTVITILILALGETAVLMLLKLLGIPISSVQQNQQLYIITAIAAKVIALLIVEATGRLRFKTLSIPRYVIFEFCGIIVINLFLLVFSVRVFQTDTAIISKDTMLTLLLLLCFTMSALTFTIIFKLSRKAKEELEEKLRIQQLEMENTMNLNMANVVESLRSLRHDMNNHIGALKGLVYAEEYDELRKYIDELYQDISPANEFVFIHNKALSALLYNKTLNAKLKQITFEPVISISDCNIPDKDMCALLGNLLDNAIEAAEKAEDSKYIELLICQKDNAYSIQCSNTFESMPVIMNGNFISSKKDKNLHGIGIKNIKAIVEKYGGTLSISYTDLFCVDITLPLYPSKDKEYSYGI